jgi:protein-tyrosine phosphatase
LPRSPEDARAIADWGAGLVISALPQGDMDEREAGYLAVWLRDVGVSWLHLPIVDWQAPDALFDEAWRTLGPRTLETLREGGDVFVHCVAGKGRSGTVVARLLIDAGVPVDDAIVATRKARPGAIEAWEQEEYLANLDK